MQTAGLTGSTRAHATTSVRKSDHRLPESFSRCILRPPFAEFMNCLVRHLPWTAATWELLSTVPLPFAEPARLVRRDAERLARDGQPRLLDVLRRARRRLGDAPPVPRRAVGRGGLRACRPPRHTLPLGPRRRARHAGVPNGHDGVTMALPRDGHPHGRPVAHRILRLPGVGSGGGGMDGQWPTAFFGFQVWAGVVEAG